MDKRLSFCIILVNICYSDEKKKISVSFSDMEERMAILDGFLALFLPSTSAIGSCGLSR